MELVSTSFKDLIILKPDVRGDARGYFIESYNFKTFSKLGISNTFVQDNQSSSVRGVLRGLHFQNAPYAQTKLVRVLSGTILDVVVDLRKDESSFGKYFSIELSADNKLQLLIPKGFAHGFVVLSKQAEVFYKCDEYYNPAAEGGIAFNDPALGIDWKIPKEEFILSEKDKAYSRMEDVKFNFK